MPTNDETFNEQENTTTGGQEPSLPPVVNIIQAAQKIGADVDIHLESEATRETKATEREEKTKSSKFNRAVRLTLLASLLIIFAVLLGAIFFYPMNENREQFAQKLVFAILGFFGGNMIPKLIETDKSEKD